MDTGIKSDLNQAIRKTRRFGLWIFLGIALLYGCFGFYKIETKQLGVLQVLGRVVNKRVLPGLHYTYPWPFAKVYRVPVKSSKRFVMDDFFQGNDPQSRSSIFYNLTGLESYCLSGDNNAVEVEIVVQYNISDPYLYIFGSTNKESLLRSIISRELIRLLSDRPVNIILTTGKRKIKALLREDAQLLLNEDLSGLRVASIDIKEVRPPASVQSYFDDVINARVDKQKMISRAQSYRNEELARARSEADRQIKEAEAYREKVIKAAQGESRRFLDTLSEYNKEPRITRMRLYVEFVRGCLSRIKNTYLIEKNEKRLSAKLRIFPGQ